MTPWPLWSLELRTERLVLRPDDDAGLAELATVAAAGIHPPGDAPFTTPWSALPGPQLAVQLLRHHWAHRATLTPSDWHVCFLVRRHDGTLLGVQSLAARAFAESHTVRTGSWLGLRHQRQGYGTEMRTAVLAFAFDFLGARVARSTVVANNVASLRVSERLGYLDEGVDDIRRRLVLSAERFSTHRPAQPVGVRGARECLPLLGCPA